MAYRPEDQRKRDDIKKKENERFQDWHKERMDQINAPSKPPKSGGCVLLLAIPTAAIGLATAAKIYFG